MQRNICERTFGKTLRSGNYDPGNTRGNLSILAPVRFNEIFGLMAWIHRVRKNPRPVPEPTVQWSRYNERKYPRYANIGRVPDHLRRAGRKRVRKRLGAHVPSICIPSRCAICIRRNLHPAYILAMETSGVSRPVDRKKFGYRYILLTLVSSSHRYAYDCLLKGYGLREGEGSPEKVLDVEIIY